MAWSASGSSCEPRRLLRRSAGRALATPGLNQWYRVDFDALNHVHWLPRLGEDNLLMTFGRSGAGELTKFHAAVLASARDHKARLVIVDTAADTFGGNENDRGQVRQFVQRALGSIALAIDGSVILCAHPSRSGIAPAKAMEDPRDGRTPSGRDFTSGSLSSSPASRPTRTPASSSGARRTMRPGRMSFASAGVRASLNRRRRPPPA